MIKIGIPQALLYYQYYPAWQTFFEELGAEVVLSPLTTKTVLAEGSARVVADTCLPVKIFLGHVIALMDKCDYVFIPALRSVERKVYNCSKFLGLPDMTRAVIPECPPILEVDIDINRGKRQLYQSIYQVGRRFTWSPLKVRRAALAAWQSHLGYLRLMSTQKLTPPQAIGIPASGPMLKVPPPAPVLANIAVIGHPYLLYDEYINHRLVHRLQQAGSHILTPEMLTTGQLDSATISVVGGAYWTYEREVVGAGAHYLEHGADGVIGVMTFGCGPDSVMMDMVRRRAAQLGTPFMCLTLEEHTASAGLVTRLEAFLDMIHRKKRAKTCA
ncbi:MAG: acyl-CoA dehydratase activase-related protein [Chloroflexota bacterium]|nr:acyl-CoA dehydratase activase-related protein [Chloroflexota bacterium]